MINIEVISSSEPLAIGPYDFHFDYLFIGRSKKCDLIFKDRELPLRFLQIYIYEDEFGECLIIKSLINHPYFFINGKKVSGSLRIRIGDIIAFGKNQIKIISFKKTNVPDNIAEEYENFEKNYKELGFVLSFIEEKIIELENKKTEN